MEASVIQVYNSKGMSARAFGLAAARITDDNHPVVVYADLVGVKTQVESIWASIVSGQNVITKGEYVREVTWQGCRELTYQRTAVRPLPHYWHVITTMLPNHNMPYGTATSALGTSKEDQLFRLLRDHSVYPVLPAWRHTLFEAGKEHALIQEAEVQGDLTWCYIVSLEGWDTAFESLAASHSLAIH